MSMKKYMEDFGALCLGSMMLSTNMNKSKPEEDSFEQLRRLR